jgi:hypothetical protein
VYFFTLVVYNTFSLILLFIELFSLFCLFFLGQIFKLMLSYSLKQVSLTLNYSDSCYEA